MIVVVGRKCNLVLFPNLLLSFILLNSRNCFQLLKIVENHIKFGKIQNEFCWNTCE
jgi:hypothetical protein